MTTQPPPYRFKILQEIGWAALIAAAIALAEVLITFRPETITDWRTWALALLGSCVRPAAAALVNGLVAAFRQMNHHQPVDPAPPR